MAPKKPNAFMVFTKEWKAKYGRHMSMQEATQEAGKIWANMNDQERSPYKQRAKEEKIVSKSNKNVEKLTCTGVPLSVVEKERLENENKERQMKRDIENTVSGSVKSDELETQCYYFIMVNYFTKTLKGGVYVPAELSLCKYSLKDGVHHVYHTLINPGVNIYGHQYEAQQHSLATHNLPLPPNAMGERNLGSIYNDILNFIRDEKTNDYPPLYTDKNSIPVVLSVLEFLKADVGANNIDLKIYSIQYLFFIMKEATCEVGDLEKPKNAFITDAYFERDYFEYHLHLACEYHEQIDKTKYCAQSCVTRWGYMFSDYMCRDIAITLIPGRHCPKNTKIDAEITPAPSTWNDSASFISMGTTSSCATKPVASSELYYEDQKSAISDGDRNDKTYTNDFPALGARKKTVNKPKEINGQRTERSAEKRIMEDDDDDYDTAKHLNPWSNRSRVVPRAPDATSFSIEYTKDETDFDDYNSVASYGRGRGSLINSTLNTTIMSTSTGRGRVFSTRK